MLASFVDLSLLKTINLLNLWLHVTPRSLRRLRASQGLIPGLLLRVRDCTCSGAMDLGSVNAPPPLDHRQSGVGWSKKGYMNREKILIEHWRWLQVNGTKQQAASCKRQALDLTRSNYRIIREYESKRSKKNN
jgi:hypothetical protein